MRVEHRARPAPDLVGGECEHQAPGGGVTGELGHGQLAGGGQDRLDQVVDGVDVAPGLGRRVGGRLDHVEVDAVAEEIPGAAEYDHADWAVLGVPVGGEQAAALAGAHRTTGERELQVAHTVILAVADLLVGAPARRPGERCPDPWHAGQ